MNIEELYPNTRWDKPKPEHPKVKEERLKLEAEQKRVDGIYAGSQAKLDSAKAAIEKANRQREQEAQAFSDRQKAEVQGRLDKLYAASVAQETILEGRKPALKDWAEIQTGEAQPTRPEPEEPESEEPDDDTDDDTDDEPEVDEKELARLRLETLHQEEDALYATLGTTPALALQKRVVAAQKRIDDELRDKWNADDL